MKPTKLLRKTTILFCKIVTVFILGLSTTLLESSSLITSVSANYTKINTANSTKSNMSYLYFGNTESFIEQVNKTDGALDTVSPSYFDLNTNGTLKSKVDSVFVAEMKKQNIKVVPFLSNHWDRNLGRKALANRKNLAKQVAKEIEKYQLDGVNVDIENVTEIDRDNYTDFVKLLREYIPSDKEVSVAVAANPNGWSKGWHGSYDYNKLAEYSDYLMIMAYDESYQGSSPGPVASISFVEKSIQYALNQNVPNDKIVLGIPFFARYWNNGVGGYGIGSNTVDTLVERYNGKIYYDENSQSPYAKFNITKYDPVTRINSKNLAPGSYVVWFEDINSIEQKIELVHKYNLRGTGSWSLNQAPSNIWEQYMTVLNNTGFFDINNHWAKEEILQMLEKGWMVGTSKNRFLPNKALTRAEATTVLVRALELQPDVIEGTSTEVSSKAISFNESKIFEDINGHWAQNEINLAYKYGLVQGINETEFAPDKYLTREEMATLLERVLLVKIREINNEVNNGIIRNSTMYEIGKNKDTTIQASGMLNVFFEDINYNRWSYASINTIASYKIMQGFTDGKFYPERYVTRAEMAAVMNRLAEGR